MNQTVRGLSWGLLLVLNLPVLCIAFRPSFGTTKLYKSGGSSFLSQVLRNDCRTSSFRDVPSSPFLRLKLCPCYGSSQRRVILTMGGKGDGKQRRDRKLDMPSSPVPSPTPTQQPSPQRVSNDINVPVRHQIMFAQMKKAAEKESTTSFKQNNAKRTAYRKSLDEEELELAKIDRKKRGSEPDWDVILNATSVSPLVLVDGYNIMHKWSRLKKLLDKGMLSKAREYLIHDMEDLKMLKGWRIEVVFDGFGRPTVGPLGDAPGGSEVNGKVSKSDQEASKKVTDYGVRVVYSGVGASADAYIESRCLEAKTITDGKTTGSLIIASDDSMIRCAAVNAGAVCMSAGRFIDELKAIKRATEFRVEVAVAKANGHEIRPSQLQGSAMPNFFRNSAVIVEDKRNKRKNDNIGQIPPDSCIHGEDV